MKIENNLQSKNLSKIQMQIEKNILSHDTCASGRHFVTIQHSVSH